MASIFFHPDAYTTAGRQVMGRHVAGETFLRGFLRYRVSSELAIQVENSSSIKVFNNCLEDWAIKAKYEFINRQNIQKLAEYGTSFYPGPALGPWARIRSLYGDTQWSLTGITHTIASDGAMDQIADLAIAPLQPWDALICTSSAVKRSVEILFEHQIDYLSHRFKAKRFPLPQLPIIPLGVDSRQFTAFRSNFEESRQKLGIASDEIVVLYVGRLSFHAKANPYPMYKALQLAGEFMGKKIVLLECGWFYNNYLERCFDQASRLLAPDLRLLRVDGRDQESLNSAWSVADIFCSFSDNIQETFGITPVEAMASGLPVVVSDWNGYKDTVRDGIEGFRIPTTAPNSSIEQGFGRLFGSQSLDYDLYLGLTSIQTSVCIKTAVKAFCSLLGSSQLRHKMGKSGRRRVQELFDWSVIIPQYEQLWSDLNDRRKSKMLSAGPSPICPYPSRPDPFKLFENYPTRLLTGSSEILMLSSVEESIKIFSQAISFKMFSPYKSFLLPVDVAINIFYLLQKSPITVNIVASHFDSYSKVAVVRTVSFMIKIGCLSLK